MNVESEKSPKTQRKQNNHQKIVTKFVTIQKNRYFWPQQMKIAGQLIEKYGLDFLLWCPVPNGYKLYSLVWFLTDIGKGYLSDQLFEFEKTKNSPTSSKVELENETIGQNIEVEPSSPKTLKDFLNYGKTTRTRS